MLPFAYYILKVIICSAVLFGYYWFFLRNKIFHSYNRFYLLAIVVLSLALPLMKINIWHKAAEPQTAVIQMLQVVNSSDEYMDDIIVYSHYNHISKEQIFSIVYIIVCAVFLFLFLQVLVKIRNLLKNNSSTFIEDIYFIKTNAKGTPFSFLKFIFWNEAIDLKTRTGSQVFRHEVAHVQEKHSYDKLFINAVLIIFWCNPFFWFIRKELNMIHEFIADKKAVEDGDTADFAAMILQATYPQHSFPLANNFFYSPIKRRLLMLTKQHKTKVSYISRLLVLPLAVVVFAAFTIKAKTYADKLNHKPLTVVIDAGHGGSDKGALALDGSNEKDITLALALKIKELNSSGNVNILLTRSTDIYQTPKEKAAYAKAVGADLLLSIHISSAPFKENSTKSGLEVFIASDNSSMSTASKLLASSVIAAFNTNYELPVLANPQQREKNILVLQESKCPAVLIEAGYLSNKKDLAYLKTDKAVETFARNVLNAIENYSVNRSVVNESPVSDTPRSMYVNVKYTDSAYLASDELKNKALLIVNSKEIGNVGYLYAEKNFSIDSIAIYDPSKAIKLYGLKGKYGVVKIISGKNTKPDYKPLLSKISQDIYISAFQDVNPAINTFSKQQLAELNFAPGTGPLLIFNGKEVSSFKSYKIENNNFTDMRVFKPETAMPTYGEKAKYGAILVNARGYPYPEKGLLVVDNEIWEGKTLQNIEITDEFTGIDRIDFLEKEEAVKKYGIKASDGAIVVTSKKRSPQSPILTLSGIADKEIDISQIKNLKEVTFNLPGYSLKSADVYFSGAGFPNPILVYLEEASLEGLDIYFKRVIAGSVITFDKVVAQRNDFSRVTIGGRSIRFHDDTKPNSNALYIGAENVIELQLENSRYDFNDITATISNGSIYKKGNRFMARVTSVGPVEVNLYVKGRSFYKTTFMAALLVRDANGLSYVPHHFIQPGKEDDNKVFVTTEIEPDFPGGREAWQDYLRKNLDSRTPLNEGWKPGSYKITVQFIVDADGNVSDVKTTDYPKSKTAQQCIDIIKKGPKWLPAKQNGKNVKAYKKQPITFVVSES